MKKLDIAGDLIIGLVCLVFFCGISLTIYNSYRYSSFTVLSLFFLLGALILILIPCLCAGIYFTGKALKKIYHKE